MSFKGELIAVFEELTKGYLRSDETCPTVSYVGNKLADSKLDAEFEINMVIEFLSREWTCGRGCQRLFSIDEVANARSRFRRLSTTEKNCYILSLLHSCLRHSESAQSSRISTPRKRQKFEYRVNFDRPVCKAVFLFYHGETQKRLKRLQKILAGKGGMPLPPEHGNKGRKPAHSCTLSDREAVKSFITNYSVAQGLPDPGRDVRRGKGRLRILLPSVMSYKSVHRLYQESVDAEGSIAVGYDTFLRIWKEEVSHITFNNPRTDLCLTCENFKK